MPLLYLLFAVWAAAIGIGIIIALMPVILFIVGMLGTIGLLTVIGMAFAAAFH